MFRMLDPQLCGSKFCLFFELLPMVQKQRIPIVAERRGPDPAAAEAPAHGVHVRHQQHQYPKVQHSSYPYDMTFPKSKVLKNNENFCAALLIVRGIENFLRPKFLSLSLIFISFFYIVLDTKTKQTTVFSLYRFIKVVEYLKS
jgi:hypothetical protein